MCIMQSDCAIFKRNDLLCWDNVIRVLCYVLAAFGGFPSDILGAYARGQEGFLYTITYALGQGRMRKHKT